jgi:hypothetical protein
MRSGVDASPRGSAIIAKGETMRFSPATKLVGHSVSKAWGANAMPIARAGNRTGRANGFLECGKGLPLWYFHFSGRVEPFVRSS